MADKQQKVAPNEEIEATETDAVEQSAEEQVHAEDAAAERIAELEAELAKAHDTIAGQKDSVVRAAAEVENIRRRTAQDVEKAHKFALEKFANELLPVIDNLERALEVSNSDDEAIKPMLEGVELTLKSMLASVAKFGIEVVDPVGEAFNPEFHQAISMLPSEEFAANTVISVMQKGYALNGRLLRPAMVIVSRGSDAPSVDTQA
ncbi:GrpE protein [Ferrimonas balearica DSM 9799]|uniref:Protein GrpE n=1 Tax=Ferrimonas balearica (strain DSM 9799 / CCM 4581 / KCTC 23876 / PAT) TaxID=550540 RepID=E1SSU9_FERBD|nr:nucleotide exchange factor GrpE [Ferrimonas balearica]MBY6017597.1 nucleotide exchange factor GrpE [Halomonas denitrificans]ADN77103.1 GrpE protein [Ferrimonas balearica DSM 9799]MBW3139902.1 nucleotide exchange factor GrpE [Ferrimonas balearica]MBW3164926.1 nucleotide exchange factor GrpE [Ferrimonas balearica]MBY5980206.1 nucleotide exchange factor GrpE [Ferrimonas balearica]